MIHEIKVPSPGESINEVEIASWLVEDGSIVQKDQEIVSLESDKATLEVTAEEQGKIKIISAEGETVAVGHIICTIDSDVKADKKSVSTQKEPVIEANPEEQKMENPTAPPIQEVEDRKSETVKVTPLAKEMMKKHDISVDQILSGLKRLGKKEVQDYLGSQAAKNISIEKEPREIEREKMSLLRRRLSERLVSVKNETAMLTTFNEVDMSHIMKLRKEYKEEFEQRHGIRLGFMSFFTKAVSIALNLHPSVNAYIDGEEIVYHKYADIGIAVQTPKGLMVPVIRNAEKLSLAGIEKHIRDLAERARNRKISVEELQGGTFTITNGGVFGSLLSTPIINPPQSAILGMHNIQERPVAIDGKVEIRPMMYLALSYDHRIIDGKDSVGFLVKVKEMIEQPERMLYNGDQAGKTLLDL